MSCNALNVFRCAPTVSNVCVCVRAFLVKRLLAFLCVSTLLFVSLVSVSLLSLLFPRPFRNVCHCFCLLMLVCPSFSLNVFLLSTSCHFWLHVLSETFACISVYFVNASTLLCLLIPSYFCRLPFHSLSETWATVSVSPFNVCVLLLTFFFLSSLYHVCQCLSSQRLSHRHSLRNVSLLFCLSLVLMSFQKRFATVSVKSYASVSRLRDNTLGLFTVGASVFGLTYVFAFSSVTRP